MPPLIRLPSRRPLYGGTSARHNECMGPSGTVRAAAVALPGLALAVASLVLVRGQPAQSPVGTSWPELCLVLAAGLALVLVGALAVTRRATTASGLLLAMAGAGWLIQAWNTPAAGSAVLFTVGLSCSWLWPVAVGHLALSYPRVASRPAFVLAGAGYAVGILLGVAPTLFFDPAAQGCNQCPGNLLLLRDQPSWASALTEVGLLCSTGWALGVVLVLVRTLAAGSTVERRLRTPVKLPAAALVALFGWLNANSAATSVGWGTPEPRLLSLQAALLLVLAAGPGWVRVRARRARSSLARLSVDVSRSLGEKDLRSTLVTLLRDPGVKVLYPAGEAGAVNSTGKPDSSLNGQALTTLTRGGVPLAWIAHRPHLLDDPAVVEEITTAAGLTLDSERLRAESRAQLVSLRASRARIVAASDTERKRLERNLHDGAQQRLVTLALALRLAGTCSKQSGSTQADSTPTGNTNDLADRCAAEVSAALADLRELAHGLFPTALVEEGLVAALEVLRESSPLMVELRDLPTRRYPPEVESAAYFLVAEILARCARNRVSVAITDQPQGLVVEVEVDGHVDRSDLTNVEDRLGALDGLLTVLPGGFASRVRAELPCGS